MAKGYRKIENVSEDNIISTITFDEDTYPEDIGKLMLIDEFIKAKDAYELNPYSGYAFLELDGKITENTEIWMWFNSVVISDKYIISLDKINDIFGMRAKILWTEK